MESQLMTKMHQCDASTAWHLPQHKAITLRIGSGGRLIQVRHGRLWLTFTGRLGHPPADQWLSADERLHLPAGSTVVVEGWPQAHFELLVPPSRISRRGVQRALCRVAGWLRCDGRALEWQV